MAKNKYVHMPTLEEYAHTGDFGNVLVQSIQIRS